MKRLKMPFMIPNDEKDDIMIDMSDLQFPFNDIKSKVNAALLFIRNIGISTFKYDFSDCDYQTKSLFLLEYIKKKNYHVDLKDLIKTWIKIVSFDIIDVKIKSILTNDEIKQFIEENNDIVSDLRSIIGSIPLCSIEFYKCKNKDSKKDLSEFDISQYKESNYDEINKSFLHFMMQYQCMIYIQESLEIAEPIWYKQYFDETCNPMFSCFITNFPFLDLINIFDPSNESVRQNFISNLDEYLNNNIKNDEEAFNNAGNNKTNE